ncbi:MAG: hypothetical protein ACJ77M_18635 [Thermoleophilaceae bacterium]|jgi:hypothetical protein
MSHSVPQQHPSVVLRSHYVHLRAFLAIAIVAVICLSAAVIVLAVDDNGSSTQASSSVQSAPASIQATPFNGGHDEGGLSATSSSVNTRSDGGPEEGTAGH